MYRAFIEEHRGVETKEMDIVREFRFDVPFFPLNEMIRYRNGEEGRDLKIEDRIEMETFSLNLYITNLN